MIALLRKLFSVRTGHLGSAASTPAPPPPSSRGETAGEVHRSEPEPED